MRLLKSRKGSQSVIEFLIGLILLCVVIFFFSRVIYSCVKPEDRSSKTFQQLADHIDALSINQEPQKEINSLFIYIPDDEMILFFDKGENYSVLFQGNSWLNPEIKLDLKELDSFFNYREKPVLYFMDKLGKGYYEWAHIFRKPAGCGDSACMVLCPEKGFDAVYYAHNKDIQFSDYQASFSNVFLSSCNNPKQLKIFDNVEKFYRKPFYAECRNKDVAAGADEKNEKYVTTILLPGAFLSTNCFIADYISKSDSDLEKELKSSGKSAFDFIFLTSRYYVAEYKDSGWEDVSLISGQYIYTQAFNNNVALCYSPPCLSLADENYAKWDMHFSECLASVGDCDILSRDIKSFANENKMTLRVNEGILSFDAGDYNFNFNKNPELWVVFENENGKKEYFSTAELVFEHDRNAAVSGIRLDAEGKKYSFISVSSQNDDIIKGLKFLVKQYEGN